MVAAVLALGIEKHQAPALTGCSAGLIRASVCPGGCDLFALSPVSLPKPLLQSAAYTEETTHSQYFSPLLIFKGEYNLF